MGRYYMLRNDEVVEEPDHAKWVEWYKSSYDRVRCVATSELEHGIVSTVFLAVNLTLSKDDPPLLFETRVKGGWLDNQWERFPTIDAARAGHEAWVARAREVEKENPLPPPGCPTW